MSNCVEQHLNLNSRDTSLIWTYSQVGHKCCFHTQSATLGVPRSCYNVRVGGGNNNKRVTRGSQFTTIVREKENVGSKGLESGKPRRHIGP